MSLWLPSSNWLQIEKCEEMGKNARQFILDNLTKEVGTKKYIDIIKSVVKK